MNEDGPNYESTEPCQLTDEVVCEIAGHAGACAASVAHIADMRPQQIIEVEANVRASVELYLRRNRAILVTP